MNGLIEHTVEAFDPRNVPEYLAAVVSWNEALPRNVAAEQKSGKRDDKDTLKLGMSLYPHLIRALEPLKILSIKNLHTSHPYHGDKAFPEIASYDDLQTRVADFADAWPEFDAVISPAVQVGTDRVQVSMFYSSVDLLHAKMPGLSKQDIQFDVPRSIRIEATFRTPEAARTGLRNIGSLFADETAFEEVLHALPLPHYIAHLHRAASSENDEIWRFGHKMVEDPLYTYQAGRGLELSRSANTHHLKFLQPHLKTLGIMPVQISYYQNSAPPGSGPKQVSVKSFDDVIAIVADENYDRFHNPEVLAVWEGKELELDLQFYAGIAPRLGTEKHFGAQIRNLSKPGTLEDLFERVLELKSS